MNTASFVPPPVHEMHAALDNLKKFLHSAESVPRLIHSGLAHAQFETLHPFFDGNRRVGRLSITFLFCQQGILQRPSCQHSLSPPLRTLTAVWRFR